MMHKAENLLVNNHGRDPGFSKPHFQPGFATVSNKCQDLRSNINNRAGEEFPVQFVNDGVASRRIPVPRDISQMRENRAAQSRENGDVKYECLTNILGLKKLESQRSDVSDLISLKEPTHEMENGASVTVGELIDEWGDHGTRVPSVVQNGSMHLNGHVGSILDDSRNGRMKFLCSFDGKILPRPSDGKLRYVGGQTRMISIKKDVSWEELMKKTFGICSQPHTIRYQLPGEDLDSLISVSSDEDLQHMIEEYQGLERNEGSQRLRIFLIPLGESDEACSFVASTIPQSDPDYQYVVAVNGMPGPTLRNSAGQCLTNEASQLNAPGLQKNSLNAFYPVEASSGIHALNADGSFNDSLNMHRCNNQSPQISSIRIKGGGSSMGYTQLLGNNSCQDSIESNASFITAQLQPENSPINPADRRYPQQVTLNLLNESLPCQRDDVCPPKKHIGGQFSNCSPHKESVTPSYLENSNFQQAESSGTNNPPFGLLHSFSDPQLHESLTRSCYCSQEGSVLSFSLNHAKAQPSSMLQSSFSQGNLIELQQDSSLLYPQLQSKLPNNIESSELYGRQDLTSSSPYSESSGTNGIHKDSILIGKKYPVPQSDVNGSSFMAKHAENNSLTSEKINIIEGKNPFDETNGNFYEGKSLAAHLGHVTELNLLDSFPANKLNAKINMQKDWELSSEDMSQSTINSKKYAVAEGMNGGQGSDFALTRNIKLNGSVPTCRETSCHKKSLGDLTCELSTEPTSCKASQVQPSMSCHDACFNEISTLSTASLYHVHHNDPGPCSNSPTNDHHIPNNTNFHKVPSFIDDDLITSTDQIFPVIGGHFAGKSKPGDVMPGLSKNLGNCDGVNQTKPFGLVEDVTGVVPRVIHSTFASIPPIVDVNGCMPVSLSCTEGDSIIADSEPEDFKYDEADKNDSLSDAMIAEMEASIYGLQIIKSADLEELKELGSGTYGTVYHGKWRGSDVAIKRIKKSCFGGKPSERERLTKDFWREAQILSNLHHPNVVAFYGIVPDAAGGTLATVTEYMVNGSLRHVLIRKDRLLDDRKRLIIAMDAAFGMEYLHSKNIVHFDLKCDNLLVNLRDPERPICKVGDFGLSRIKRNTLISGGVRGTLPWMAPELLNGSSNRVSEKVDVFSFGISMWELLTGEEPYADMHYGAIIGGIVKNTLRPPIPEHCDPEWKKLMEDCWSRDPESRPSFTEITNRLRSMYKALQAKGVVRHDR
ncbi:hypothetical protein HN51_022437 [Arachis hypogaea]|uniref:Protein kinase domain-containing protein n=1 Tax=Arachis hypogaea TaxID=3818 RepID=A0A445ECT1_ARAHY|nr:dual specificity protein kinase splB isoform X1 [Arachis hypogaea]XP_025651433.1 dual specificity protein kinase splB isoform X1 [Arachis hypogaea]QHO53668.1 uncharacterized protein DS421_2g49970 [Arachis hypogaea]QHO53669.1 uncharacterized protein DS421_2g49970 [Arachis hypogaea]RYR73119.1 hypothetical protein Ahy_A02g007437 [Arachis hypogaea]